ncbi:MAG: hypothetical protein QOI94_750, partial [Acidobacteriaceae bacterium]|nr:hypothetical protein [Acidobacteriaceae bacterium]
LFPTINDSLIIDLSPSASGATGEVYTKPLRVARQGCEPLGVLR